MERVRAYKAAHDQERVDCSLAAVSAAASGTDNLLPPMREALRAGATLGQIVNALRAEFGSYRAPE